MELAHPFWSRLRSFWLAEVNEHGSNVEVTCGYLLLKQGRILRDLFGITSFLRYSISRADHFEERYKYVLLTDPVHQALNLTSSFPVLNSITMRSPLFAVFSVLAALAVVNALPVENLQRSPPEPRRTVCCYTVSQTFSKQSNACSLSRQQNGVCTEYCVG